MPRQHFTAYTPRLDQKLIVEFIGTFFLVLTIGCSVLLSNSPDPVGPALAIGSVLMVLVYAGGHISGAHYNPAVSLAIMVRGDMKDFDEIHEVAPYMIVQVVGAIFGGLATRIMTKKTGSAEPVDWNDMLPAFLAEFLFTFALAFVVLNVAVSPTTKGNSYYGLAIGFTVLSGAIAVGSISGGAFNPAVAIACAIMDLIDFSCIILHIVAELAGGALAGLAHRYVEPPPESSEDEEAKETAGEKNYKKI
jgi:aquaporin Z